MDILTLLEEIRTVARNGLAYAQNPYDRERYSRLLDAAVQTYSETLDIPSAEVRARLTAELGYTTPKVGGDAAVFDEEGRVLLVQRADDRTWCLPCGWVDPNESPRDCAVREAREETGLIVRPLCLVDVFSLPAGASNHVHGLVAVVYLCEVTGGTLRVSHESLDVRYWHIADVPSWHPQHQARATAAYDLWCERRGKRNA